MGWAGAWHGDVARTMGNAAANEALPRTPETQDPLAQWLAWGKPVGRDAERSAAQQEVSQIESLLAARQTGRAMIAAEDREAGLSSVESELDAQQTAVQGGIDAFAHIPLPEGGAMAAPYQLNIGPKSLDKVLAPDQEGWEYGLRKFTSVPLPGVAPAAIRQARSGRGAPDQLAEVLGALSLPGASDGMVSQVPGDNAQQRMRTKEARILPPRADPAVATAARTHAAAQTAGLGVDCAGFVLQAQGLAGLASPEAVAGRGNLNVTDVLDQGERFGGKQADGSIDRSPLDAAGRLRLQPGDAIQIDNVLGPAGHIAIVEQAEDVGDEVIVHYAHSSDNQGVMAGNTDIGRRAEGVRRDLAVFDKATATWRTVRGAYSSRDLNRKRIQGFSRPKKQESVP